MREFYFDEIGSTSDFLKNKKDKKDFDLAISKIQTSGRGRRGNLWVSPEGAALFSFCFKEDKNLSMEDYSKLPLVVGLSLLKGLKKVEDLNYKFKWTNDIYLDDKKLSGILVEKVEDFYIIGIGINVNNLEFLGDSINGISLKSKTKKDYKIKEIIHNIVNSFKSYWIEYVRGNWNEMISEINQYNYLYNRNVTVKFPLETVEGVTKKILKNGKLEFEQNGEIKEIMIGEVHIKI